MLMTVQANEGFYHDQHSMNAFLSFVVEIFDCLHQQAIFFSSMC